MSEFEIVKSEYNALGEDNNYKTHYFKTSADQVVGLGRTKSFSYSVGDVVYSDTNNKVALKCTTTGTTSADELDISANNVGDSVTDGSVVWVVVSRDAVAIIDKERPIKTFYSLNQLGLSNATVTWELIRDTMPNNSIFIWLIAKANAPLLDLPKANNVRLLIVNYDNVLIINACPVDAFELFWAKVTSGGHQGWVEMAQNGKLSMPDMDNRIVLDNSVREYTAPADGWMAVQATKNSGANYGTLRINNVKRSIFGNTGECINSTGLRLALPIAKGDSVQVYLSNMTPSYIVFYYAQSEV